MPNVRQSVENGRTILPESEIGGTHADRYRGGVFLPLRLHNRRQCVHGDCGTQSRAFRAVLILAFFNAAGLFLLTGAEFLAMILLVVYVGAVAVLFLFVVMMLDVDFAELKSGALQYAPVGALVGLILAAELIVVLGGSVFAPKRCVRSAFQPTPDVATRSQTRRRSATFSTRITSISSRSQVLCCWLR